jgi:hypothetical protein
VGTPFSAMSQILNHTSDFHKAHKWELKYITVATNTTRYILATCRNEGEISHTMFYD